MREHLGEDGLVVGRAALREAPTEVLTLPEAAALLRLPEPAVGEAAERGELPARRIGKEWRFSRRALLEWLGTAPTSTRDAQTVPVRPTLRETWTPSRSSSPVASACSWSSSC